MKWLITGGCGFIGTSLIKRLVKEKTHQILVVDNLGVGTKKDLSAVTPFREIPHSAEGMSSLSLREPAVFLVVGDTQDPLLAQRMGKGIDIIIHLAASSGVPLSIEDPQKDFHVNVVGTMNYLESARINKIPKFIFASSGAVLGEQEPPFNEEKLPRPVSPYGAGKLAGEAYCLAYHRSYGVGTEILRFGNVYGPGSTHKNSVVAKFIKQALKGETLEIYGDGKQTRDFIYVDDLIEAVTLSAEKMGGGEIFQIASFSETTVEEIASLISSLAGSRLGIRPKVVHTKERPGDVRRNYSDISKAQAILGWSPKTGLQDGLSATFDAL